MTPKFQMIPIRDLLITKEYGTQRVEGVSIKRAEKMGANFDLSKAGVITVSKRKDGSYFVADGAHRTHAAVVAGIEELPAMVHSGLTLKQEAELFYSLNDFKAPSAVSKFKANVAKGDPTSVRIEKIVEAHGWRIATSGRDGTISCVSALERIYRNGAGPLPNGEHGVVLDWALDISTAAWGHDRDAASDAILLGLAQLTARYGSDVDASKLVSEMSLTRPKAVIGHAKALRDAAGGAVPAHVAKVLVGMHNKRRRTNLLPEWVWTR